MGAMLVSYLSLKGKFCSALIEWVYQDALLRRQEILDFFGHISTIE